MDILKKVNYIFDRKQKKGLAVNAFLAIIAGMLELLGVSALLPLVDVLLDESLIQKKRLYRTFAEIVNASNTRDFIVSFSICLIVIYVFKNLYLMVRYKIQMEFVFGNMKALASKLMNCYLGQSYLFHVNHSATELQRNVNNDVQKFMKVISSLITIAVEGLTFACMLLFLLVTDPITTVIMMGIFGVVFVCIYGVFKKNQVKVGKAARAAAGEMNKWIMQSFGGIKELKVLNREQFFIDNFEAAYDKSNVENIKNELYTGYPKYVTEVLTICGLLTTIIIRMLMGVNPKEFAISLSAFALAAMRMLPSFNRITEHIANILYCKASVGAIYEDIRIVEELKGKSIGHVGTSKLLLNDELRLDNISFKYPEGDKNIFENLNLSIKKNQSIALIGESGAGKTTLADIMLGLLEPTSGKVTVDGTDIFEHEYEWHRAVGYIPQMIYLIDDTIRANVVFGDSVDEERVWKALEDAQLADFVKELPDGLETVVGDRGVKLSGGQRQRIGIARALYANPSVLFLDEATSALDSETENAVMESINYLHGKTTMVLIAHRLSTIRNCDQIYEVGKGMAVLRDKQSVFSEETRILSNALNCSENASL